jgi:hypothetical protein
MLGGTALAEDRAALWLAVMESSVQLQRKTGTGCAKLLHAVDAAMAETRAHRALMARRRRRLNPRRKLQLHARAKPAAARLAEPVPPAAGPTARTPAGRPPKRGLRRRYRFPRRPPRTTHGYLWRELGECKADGG